MKKTTKKLVLSKETLRALNDADLGQVGGGAPNSAYDCNGGETMVTDCYTNARCKTFEHFGCCR
jgi:hypothetical protein